MLLGSHKTFGFIPSFLNLHRAHLPAQGALHSHDKTDPRQPCEAGNYHSFHWKWETEAHRGETTCLWSSGHENTCSRRRSGALMSSLSLQSLECTHSREDITQHALSAGTQLQAKLSSPRLSIFDPCILSVCSIHAHTTIKAKKRSAFKSRIQRCRKMFVLKASSEGKPARGIICQPAYLQWGFGSVPSSLHSGAAKSPSRRAVKLLSCCLRSLLKTITGNNTNKSKWLKPEGSGREQLNEQLGAAVARDYIVL